MFGKSEKGNDIGFDGFQKRKLISDDKAKKFGNFTNGHQ